MAICLSVRPSSLALIGVQPGRGLVQAENLAARGQAASDVD